LNTVGADGDGIGPTAINWNASSTGYVQALYNGLTGIHSNGLLVKSAGNTTNSVLSVDQ